VEPWVAKLREYLTTELTEYERSHGIGPETVVTRAQLEPVWRRSLELGFYGIHLPKAHGGQGLTYSELCLLKEEAAASGRALFHSVLGDMGGPLRVGALFEYASEGQLDRYLFPVVRAERACCFALTETDAGSDVKAMRTRAVPEGTGWKLTGHKVFSSAAPFADFAIVIARTEDADAVQPEFTAFLVDLDAPGCKLVPGDVPMSGQHIEGDILLEDCFVPAENVIGGRGHGLAIGLGRITVNRLLHCPTILGLGRRTFELSVEFARTRRVGGKPLIELQAIQHKLADMATSLYAARSMVLATAGQLDRGEDIRAEASMCKLFVATEMFKVADQSVQIHGKAGMVQGSEVEWLFRTVRMMFRVLTGTDEIQRNTIAKALR
jgi:acyl-CoA dehydrogenase